MKPLLRSMVLLGCVWSASESVLCADDTTVVSVFAQTANGYKRQTLPNGSFKREYYAISNGGAISGTVRDAEVDKVTYPQIAGIVAEQLAKQNYFLAPDTKSAELLLIVYWGTTVPFNDGNYRNAVGSAASALSALNATSGSTPPNGGPAPGPGVPAGGAGGFEVSGIAPEVLAARDAYENALQQVVFLNRIRDRGNEANARLLGYIGEINHTNDIARLAGGGDSYNDLISDIEEPRYYVVVQAYDFREALKQNRKALWVTRISIRTHRNRFTEKLLPMLASASSQFGSNSSRLQRKRIQEGKVEIGEATVIGTSEGTVESKKK